MKRRLKKSVKRALIAFGATVILVALIASLAKSCSKNDDKDTSTPSSGSSVPTSSMDTSEDTSDPSSSVSSDVSAASTSSEESEPESSSPITENTPTIEAGKITSISLTTNEVTLFIGDSFMPIVTMHPTDAPDKSEIWESDNESVATVDQYGNITGVAEGSCTVTVTAAANPAVFSEVSVTVQKASETVELTFIDGILIANKTYALPADYAPGLDSETEEAFNTMAAAAAKDGINLYISSGYRSYDHQKTLYNNYVARDGQAAADTYSARPGHSEHQTGLALDLNIISDAFIGTPEAIWIAEHCHEYGFIVRYPKDKEHITGYKYEPWHVRYLGVDTAKAVFESGLTLEEYLGITSEYQN